MVTDENGFEMNLVLCAVFVTVYLSYVLLYFLKSLICIGWDTFCFACKNCNRCKAVCMNKPNETTTDSVIVDGLHRRQISIRDMFRDKAHLAYKHINLPFSKSCKYNGNIFFLIIIKTQDESTGKSSLYVSTVLYNMFWLVLIKNGNL